MNNEKMASPLERAQKVKVTYRVVDIGGDMYDGDMVTGDETFSPLRSGAKEVFRVTEEVDIKDLLQKLFHEKAKEETKRRGDERGWISFGFVSSQTVHIE